MAKKTKQTGEFDLDADLSFDEFDFGDFDGQMNPGVTNTKSRSPLTDVFRGTISGMKDEIKNPSFIKKVVTDSLPPNYEYALGETGKALDGMSNLYNEASREIKPQLQRLSSKVDKLIPVEQKLLKKMSNKFKELVGVQESSIQSNENLQEQAITNGLAQVFAAQAATDNEVRAKEYAEEKIQEQIETKRFKSNFGLLSNINDSLGRMVSYQDRILISYQKKSLELQYRSYFVQSELLDTSKKFFSIFEKQNEGIVKNTGLPEYVKITTTEKMKEIAQTSLFGNIQGSITKKLRAKVKEQLQGFSEGVAASEQILEMAETMRDNGEMMEQMGVSKNELMGTMLGAQFMDFISKKFTDPLKEKLSQHKGFMKKGNKLASTVMNKEGELQRYIDENDIVSKSFGSGPEALRARAILTVNDLLGTDATSKIKDGNDLGKINEPYYVTRKAVTSLTEVIPGLLSRIHYEVSAQRLGPENAKMLSFDYQSGKFRTSTELSGIISKTIDNKIQSASSLGYRTDKAYGYLTGGETLDSDVELELKKFIVDSSQEKIVFDRDGLEKSKSFGNLSDKARDVVMKNLTQMFDGEQDEESKLELTSKFLDVKKSLPDISKDIKTMVEAGYGPQLEKMGLITIDEKGEHKVNMEKYRELMIKNHIVVSDENKKTGIKDYNPKAALNAIKKTKVYSWFFKKGQGPQEEKLGPMAQDVKKNVGEEAAPGGVSIDMTNMNGANMAAIQALAKEQENQINNTSATKHLLRIDKNVSNIFKLMNSGKIKGKGTSGKRGSNSVSNSKDDGYLENVQGIANNSLNLIFKTISDGIGLGTTAIKSTRDNVIKPAAKGIGKLYSDNKEGLKDGIKFLYDKAIGISGSVLDSARDIVTDKIPRGLKFGKDQLKKLKDSISNFVSGPLNVYIKGTAEPLLLHTLMRAGEYIDSGSNKVIKTVEDIKNAKGDIIDKSGKVVLSLSQIAQGIYDDKGKEIKTMGVKFLRASAAIAIMAFRKAKTNLTKLFNTSKGMGKSVKDAIKGKFSKLKTPNLGEMKDNFLASLSEMQLGFSTKSYETLVEIRDLIKNKFGVDKPTIGKKGFKTAVTPSSSESSDTSKDDKEEAKTETTTTEENKTSSEGGIINRTKNMLGSFRDKIKDKVPKIKGKGFGGIIDRTKNMLGSFKDKVKDKTSKIKGKGFKGLLGGMASFGSKFLPSSNSNTDEQTEGKKESISKKISKTVSTVADKAKETGNKIKDRVGGWKQRLADQEKNEKKTKFVDGDLSIKYAGGKSLLDMIAEKSKGMFDMMSSGLGDFFGKSGKGGLLSTIGKKLSTLGTKAKGLFKGTKGLSTAANVASKGSTMARAGSMALTAGRVVMAGASLAGTGIMAVGGSLLAGLATIITSPVVVGAGIIGGIGLAGYLAYKYFKGNANEFDKLRLYQYGLTQSPAHQSHYREIIALENYLVENALGFGQSKEPYLNGKKLDMKELLNIFSIDEKDSEGISNFSEWFDKRFKPFFLHNIGTLYSVNNKVNIQDIKGKLKTEEKIKYLAGMSLESGPYDVTTSPFKDIEYLNNDKSVAINAIKNMTEQLGKEKIKEADKAKQGDDRNKKSPPPATIDTPKPIDTKVSPGNNKPTETKDVGGEGDGPKAPSSGEQSSSSSSKIDKLKVASGPLSNGDDADKYIKLNKGANIQNLNPKLLKNLRGMIQEYGELTGKSISINDGHRSRAEQERLFRKDPKKAARPGGSLHEFGLAVDIDGVILDELENAGLMRKYGFTRPVGGEKWHAEPAGIQGSITSAKSDPNLASQLVDNSIGKGGGGLALVSGAKKYSRDTQHAVKTMDASDSKVKPEGTSEKPKLTLAVDNTKGQIANSEKISKNSNLPDKSSTPVRGGSYGGSVDNTTAQQTASVGSTEAKGDVNKAIEDASKQTGADTGMMKAFATIESGMNPNAKAKTSSATGLYQFTNATWKEQVGKHGSKYGIAENASPNDPVASSLMAGELIKQNMNGLKKVKENPDMVDLYLSHFLGLGGARKFISADQNATGESILPDAAKANKSIFYEGGRARTISEIRQLITSKVQSAASKYGVDVSQKAIEKAQNQTPVINKPVDNIAKESTPELKPVEATAKKPLALIQNKQPTSITPSNDNSRGQNLGQDNINTGLNTVNDTMTKSLDVQTQMLEVLRDILKNVNPENIEAFKESLTPKQEMKSVNQAPRQLPTTGLDLRRKTA